MPKYLFCRACDEIRKLTDCKSHEELCERRYFKLTALKPYYEQSINGNFEPADLDNVKRHSAEYLDLLENKWGHVTEKLLVKRFSYLLKKMPKMYSRQIENLQTMKENKEEIINIESEWKHLKNAWEQLEKEGK